MDRLKLNWRNGDHGWRHAVRAEWTIPPLWYSRDTGSITCVVKSSPVKPEQMTGSYELCMLIDGVVKRYLTAIVDLKFWHPILYWHGKSVVHGHTSPGHNCWQYTRCSWPRHRHKTTRCQIYIRLCICSYEQIQSRNFRLGLVPARHLLLLLLLPQSYFFSWHVFSGVL